MNHFVFIWIKFSSNLYELDNKNKTVVFFLLLILNMDRVRGLSCFISHQTLQEYYIKSDFHQPGYLFSDVRFYHKHVRLVFGSSDRGHPSSLVTIFHWSHLSAPQIKSLTWCRLKQNSTESAERISAANGVQMKCQSCCFTLRQIYSPALLFGPEASTAVCQVSIYCP